MHVFKYIDIFPHFCTQLYTFAITPVLEKQTACFVKMCFI